MLARCLWVLWAIAMLGFAPALAAGEEEDSTDPDRVAWKTDRVVVFKDGYGLVIKHGRAVVGESGSVYTEEVPNAVLGTVWARTTEGQSLSMKAETVETVSNDSVTARAAGIGDLLRGNVGREARLILHNETIEGKIESLLAEPPSAPPQPITSANPFSTTPSGQPAYVAMRLPTGSIRIVPIHTIIQVEAADLALEYTDSNEVRRQTRRLFFEFGPGKAGQAVEIEFCYFTRGLRWIPTYRLDGDLEGEMELFLQAEIINDVEDLHATDVHLVVGVPHFRYRDEVSPLSLEQQLHATFHTLGQQQVIANNAFANSGFMSQSIATDTAAPDIQPVGEMEGAMQGERRQSLYVYTLQDISLARGARASHPIGKSTVTPSHVFRLQLETRRGGAAEYYSSSHDSERGGPVDISRNEVWQTIEIRNEGKAPWTTGPVLVMSDALPVCQELLTYTAPGARATIPLTIAVNVQAVRSETETRREPNAIQWNNRSYALIEKSGTITLNNYEDKEAVIRVRLSTGGKVETATDNGNVTINDYRASDWEGNQAPSLNRHSDVEWLVTLAPGEKKEIGYTATYYVP